MLTEIHLKQHIKDRKRWFQDEYFDLFTWQDNTGKMTSFQLCYDRHRYERVIFWDANKGFGHRGIDNGETLPQKNMSPIFVNDGIFPYQHVIPKFIQSSQKINQDISRFVVQKINEYVQKCLCQEG